MWVPKASCPRDHSFPQDIVSRENGGPICRADLFPTSARGVGRILSKKVIGVEEGAQNRGWCSWVLALPCVPQALSGPWVSSSLKQGASRDDG